MARGSSRNANEEYQIKEAAIMEEHTQESTNDVCLESGLRAAIDRGERLTLAVA